MSDNSNQDMIVNDINTLISGAAIVTPVIAPLDFEVRDSNIVGSDDIVTSNISFNGGVNSVVSGQIFSHVELVSGAELYVSGGVVNDIVMNTEMINDSAHYYVPTTSILEEYSKIGYDQLGYSVTYQDTYYAGPTLYVSAGGVVSGAVVESAGVVGEYGIIGHPTTQGWQHGYFTTYYVLPAMYVLSGGQTYNAKIYGNQYISSGGIANITVISGGGEQYISSGGIANSTVISGGGEQYISSGGVANITVISGGGEQYISSGGIANSTVISGGGEQYISSCGVVNSTVINDGGKQYISSGGVANITVISVGGEQYISSDGIASNTVISGGTQSIGNDGSSLSVSVDSDGRMYISGGDVFDVIVASGGSIYYYGGTLSNLSVASGGVVNNVYYSQNTLIDHYTGSNTIVSNVVFDGGVHDIGSGQGFDGLQLSNNAHLYISGGHVSNVILNPTTSSALSSGFSFDTSVLLSNFSSSALEYNSFVHYIDNYYAGTEIYVSAGGVVSNVIISRSEKVSSYQTSGVPVDIYYNTYSRFSFYSVPVQHVLSGGSVYNVAIDGLQYVSSGGFAMDTSIGSAGHQSVLDGGTLAGQTLVSSGGYLSIANGGILDGDVTLNPGGSVTIGLSNGGSVDLIGDSNSGLIISGYTAGQDNNVTTVISGFSGNGNDSSDKIVVDGLRAANISTVTFPDNDHITLQLLDGTSLTLNMVGIKQTGYSFGTDANGDLTMVVCFLSGTLIQAVNGLYAVEDLQVGDKVLTFDPKTNDTVEKKVTWVGQQHMRVNPELPDDQAGYPVRILKDAFARNVPNKDLLITPEHCLYIDGYFIPARLLVNGRSIFYDYSITSYDFYHLETEDHSVIWADGMMTESYLNTGNRHNFRDDRLVVPLDVTSKSWETDAAAPLMVARDIVEPIYHRLADYATQQGMQDRAFEAGLLTSDPDLYLLTDQGKIVHKVNEENGIVNFVLPEHTQSVRLVSNKCRPSDTQGPFVDDRRELGICVGHITVTKQSQTLTVTTHLENEMLDGWWGIEQSFGRWTKGDALLPLTDYASEKYLRLSVQILAAGPYLVKQQNNKKIA